MRREWLEAWEERAAIMEHDGGLEREDAERKAWSATVVALGLCPVR